MVDRGSGIPVVLIPGVQGRWEWMAPTVDALAACSRIITFSLADEPTSGFRFDPRDALGSYVGQVREALDRAGVDKAVIVGVSFSGLIATEFAARCPERVRALVLASALPPGWTPDARARFYLRAPRLLSPVFWVTSPARMLPELRSALGLRTWPRFALGLCGNSIRASLSPTRMANRVRLTAAATFCDVSTITTPTLLITGEDRLDRVVRPALTREYLTHLPQARHVTLRQTGHLGLLTRPQEFAALIHEFAVAQAATDDARRSA